MEAKRLALIFILFFVLINSVSASGTGICVLDQASYIPNEIATFSCTCTHPLQENVAGNFVWIKNDTTILLNETTTSGLCRSAVFSSNFIIPNGGLYDFNVTFVTADTNWDDPTDVVTDEASVLVGSSTACLISDITFLDGVPLGQLSASKITVKDSVDNGSLINVGCRASIYTLINGSLFPVISLPYNEALVLSNVYSTSDGEVIILHNFEESFWEPNSSYFVEYHCYCPNNSTDGICINSLTGVDSTFKQCNVLGTFEIGEDLRDNKLDSNLFPLLSVIIIIALLSIGAGAYNKSRSIKLLGYGYGFIQLAIALFFVSVNKLGESIDSMVSTNLNVSLLLLFIVSFIYLIKYMIRLINPGDNVDDKTHGKWGR